MIDYTFCGSVFRNYFATSFTFKIDLSVIIDSIIVQDDTKYILSKTLADYYAIKRTQDTIIFNFFIFIYHIYVQGKSRTSFANNMTSANEYTNKQVTNK